MDAQKKTKQINNVKLRQAADEVVVELVEKHQAGGLWGRDTGTGGQPEATSPNRYHHTLTGSGSVRQAQKVFVRVLLHCCI